MKNKGLLFITLACAGLVGTGATVALATTSTPIVVHAEEGEEGAETLKGTIDVSSVSHCEIVGIAGGEHEVGSTVEFSVSAIEEYYTLKEVLVNGKTLVANESGIYSFEVVEGVNTIKTILDFDEKAYLAKLWATIKETDWQNIFTVQNLMLLINYLINSGLGIGLVTLFSKYRKTKTIDREDVIKVLKDTIPEQTDELIEKIFGERFVPMLTEALEKMGDMQEAITVLSRCMALAQENTPESRIAIVELLSKIKLGDKNVSEEVMRFIQDELAKITAKVEENKNLLAELRVANEKAKETAKKELLETAVSETKHTGDNGTQI